MGFPSENCCRLRYSGTATRVFGSRYSDTELFVGVTDEETRKFFNFPSWYAGIFKHNPYLSNIP